MNRVFLDTAGILAMSNRRDSFHENAVRINQYLEEIHVRFVITDFIVVEVCNSLSKHKHLALKFLKLIQESDDIEVIPITKTRFEKALQMYQEYTDKDWGLTDITSFLIMKEYGIQEVFTCDHHFKQMGFTVLI